MDASTRQHIKGYDLGERIGAGGFGAVYKAYQSTVGREVAIKIILPGLASQPDFIRRFESEAQLVARLEHPHITPLYDYWRDPDGAYLVMRWLRGGNLRDALELGAFELRAAALLLDQIAAALSLAHRNGVIHRDIKPANILLDEDSNAYLSDFGIAKNLNLPANHTQQDAIVGSLDYISPEQARSEPVTPRTDIYSLGVTMYEVVTGHHPFENISAIERLYKHINDPLPDITSLEPGVTTAVNRVIQSATAKNPEQRYPDALAFAADFREAVGLNRTSTSLVELLTQREHEILQLIVDGLSNKEIARHLTIALGTVKWHVYQIYGKLGVRSRVQAIIRARELNLITKPGEGHLAAPVATEDFHPQNPYKGLLAFQAADNQDFFGRETITAKLIRRMGETGEYCRFLAIIGPSGSGKSSLVKAGVIPALWRGDLPGSEKWFIVDMLPGSHPLDELEVALTRIAANQTQHLNNHLGRDERGLIRAASLILPSDGSELVLIIDQFEEVFTLVSDEQARQKFLNLIYAAVTDPRSRVRVVITLRADFYDRPLYYPKFGDLARSRLETIMPLSVGELERAITGPAARVGVTFEPGLVASIIGEVNYQPGALPLLQYALTELFDQRQGRRLTHEAYQAIGGTVGALAKSAEEVYSGLDSAGQEAARQMFLRLVTLGDGKEDTRRRTGQSELLALTHDTDQMEDLIDSFASYRLLSLDNDPGTRAPTVEVAHEALLREWERLREWLNDSRDEIIVQRQLASMAEDWCGANRDASFLARGSRLEQFEQWAANAKLVLTGDERAYLDASLAEREQQTIVERERTTREIRLEQRSRTFLRGLVAVLLLATLVAFGLTGVAVNQGNLTQQALATSDANYHRAEAQRLAGEASQLLNENENSELIALLSIRSINTHYSPQGDAALVAAATLHYPKRIYTGSSDSIWTVAFTPDGQSFATAHYNLPTAELFDVETGQQIRQFVGHEAPVTGVVFSPDGKYLLTTSVDSTARLWDVQTGEEIRQFVGHQGWVSGADFSSDGRLLTTAGSNDSVARLWDVQTGEEIRQFVGHVGWLVSIKFSPDGKFILTGGADQTARLWGVETGEEIRSFVGHTDWLWGQAAFSPDGRFALTGSLDRTARLWDVETGEEVQQFVGHTNQVRTVAFSPDGSVVLTASGDHTARLWDAQTGVEVRRLAGHRDEVWGAAFSPDGRYILTGSNDMTARLWAVQEPLELSELKGHTDEIMGVTFSPDGKTILTGAASGDHTARLWDAQTGQEIHRFENKTEMIGQVAFSPDGRYFVLPNGEEPSQIRDASTYEEVCRLEHPLTAFATTFSSDGQHVYVSSGDGTTRAWNTHTCELVRSFEGSSSGVNGIAVSPDDHYMATGSADGMVRLWNAQTGEPITVLELSNPVGAVAFLADSRTIVVGSGDGSIQLWDVQTKEFKSSLTGHRGMVWHIAISPDGHYLLSGGEDKTARLWNVQTGQELRRFTGHSGKVNAVAFSPDGQHVLTGSADHTVRLWDIDYHDTLNDLCSRLQRDFSDDEREQYEVQDSTPTCPQFATRR